MSDTHLFGIERKEFAFYMAKDFFEKGINATKEAHPVKFTFEKDSVWELSFPICNLSFSLELILKSFLSKETLLGLKKKKEGHKLSVIYNEIDLDTQIAIQNHFETCVAHNYDFFNIILRSAHLTPQTNKDSTVKEKIFDALQRCNEPFIQFRYLYEFEESIYYFDFNTIIKLIHSCLAIKANELGISI